MRRCDALAQLRQPARQTHPQHCIYTVLRLAGNMQDCRSLYVRALARFPIARRVLQERLREQALTNHARRLHQLKELKTDSWHFDDPFAGCPPADPFDDETEEEYDFAYNVVVPGASAPELPFGK